MRLIPAIQAVPNAVEIDYGAVPELPQSTALGVLWQASAGCFRLEVPGVARYRVECGARILIEPAPGASESDIQRHLHLSPLAALYFQRGQPALHAAAAVGPDGAVLLGGDSGAGKSTLLAALLQRGWHYLGDELAPIALDAHGRPRVLPTLPSLLLWPDARKQLGADENRLAQRFIDTPQPLRAIYWLSEHKQAIEVRPVEGAESFQALTALAYNTHIAEALLPRADFLRHAAAVLATARLYRLYRQRGVWDMDALVECVLAGSAGS